jgi:UDP-N-acetylmuramyl-tripeptide synthetase
MLNFDNFLQNCSDIVIHSLHTSENCLFFINDRGVDFINIGLLKNFSNINFCTPEKNLNYLLKKLDSRDWKTVKMNEEFEEKNNLIITFNNDFHSSLVECLEKKYKELPQNLVAVTGTNGKSSTVHFCNEICGLLDKKSASIGTLGLIGNAITDISNINYNCELTTPDIATMYRTLNKLAIQGVKNVFIEASSHALHQGRFGNLKFDIAIFTNLSLDHLDYHKTMEDYFLSKKILFDKHLKKNGSVIINCDDEYGKRLSKLIDIKTITYGSKNCDFNILEHYEHNNNLECLIKSENFSKEFAFNFLSSFQLYNSLASILAISELQKILPENLLTNYSNKLASPCGRFEFVAENKNGGKFFVDFAHTPDALRNVLDFARNNFTGKLICVFGCGGDRDNSKRPIMGKIAVEFCDLAIITDDNPRTEDPLLIRKQIITGIDEFSQENNLNIVKIDENFDSKIENGKYIYEAQNRSEAIEFAVKIAQKNDIVIIAGKGHENYQITGTTKHHFSDQEELKRIIEKS